MPGRYFLIGIAILAGLVCSGSDGLAQSDYPNRAITILVPFPGGGPSDALTRTVADSMSRSLGQPIVIQNIPVGGGTVGTLRAKRAAPDGYTIVAGQLGTHAAAVAFQPRLPYDPRVDFTPIGLVASNPVIILGRRDFPPKDLKEFMSYARASSHRLEEAHAGPGSISFVACTLLNQLLGVRPSLVPHDGAVGAIEALAAGQVDYMCDQLISAVPAVRARRVKAYAVAAPEPNSALPEVPTTREAGLPDYEISVWTGLFAPVGVASPVVHKLNGALSKALDEDAVRQRLVALGGVVPAPAQRTPESLAELVRSEIARWMAVGKTAGMVPNR
jgi:tripartite-type tricarboxylate transporter receptor subunit TctC